MRPSVATAVAVGLWVLVKVSPMADPGGAEPRRCLLSHYRSLDPRALAAVKALRDHYEEETLSWRPRNCSFRPRRDPPKPSSCAQLRLVARGLSDAQAVLSSLPNPEMFPGVVPTLELLAAAERNVVACTIRVLLASPVCDWEAGERSRWETRFFAFIIYLLTLLQLQLVRPGSSRKSPAPRRRRPKTRRPHSSGCHEAGIIFNLLRLLTWDLRLVAHSGPCV
ncbi:interferon lambda-4-like [Rhynchonycteris naso]